MTRAAMPGPWDRQALCRGKTDVFFPPTGRPENSRQRSIRIHTAQNICRQCPVSGPCFEFARDNGEQDGIWGGVVFDRSRHVPTSHNRKERNVA